MRDLNQLMASLEKKGNGCWEWARYRDPCGYGRVCWEGRSGTMVHRVMYELLVGPIPAGLTIDHLCRNPACGNPAHLEPVTHAENQRRRAGTKTHCINGHELTSENVYLQRGGRKRVCRRCQNAAQRRHKARQKAQGVAA